MNLKVIAIGSGLVVASALLAAMLIGPRQVISASNETLPRVVSVSGLGEIKIKPDMATITSGVTSEAPTAKAALAKNNAAMNAVITALKNAGVAEDDIQTSNFSVSPMYAPVQPGQINSPQISHYQVSNQVNARVKNLSKLGPTLDALVQAGSNQISGIMFDIDDPKSALNDARKKAIADAKSKAELYASAAGVSVGAVLQISETGGVTPVIAPNWRSYASADAAAVPIAPGMNTVSANVTVLYELR